MNTFEERLAAAAETRQKTRVLMVDDEVAYVRLAKMNLEAEGSYMVEAVSKAGQAVKAALHFKPDVVLLDVMMPDGDGGDLAATMQDHASLQSVPIIFITAAIRKSEADQRRGRIGGRRLLAKPVTTEEIIQAIDEELGR